MNQREFTLKESQLVLEMARAGKGPIRDWFARTQAVQFMLFQVGRKLRNPELFEGKSDAYKAMNGTWDVVGDVLTYKDGYAKTSAHQTRHASDIYLAVVTIEKDEDGNDVEKVKVMYDWDEVEAEFWHARWVEMGGKPPIRDPGKGKIWDAGHFEG